MEWISVKDRLPELETWVLAYSAKDDLIACSFTRIGNQHPIIWNLLSSGCGCCDSDLEEVTHWMPLPDKPDQT